MPTRRKTKAFRPLESLPRPLTPAAEHERHLRELEAEETAQDALRFAREIRRREALNAELALEGDHHHPDPLQQPDDVWEDIPPTDHNQADRPGDPELAHDAEFHHDPIILSLHEQAKQLKRKKLQENWEAQYRLMFDAFLEAKHASLDWSTPDWSQDQQPACNCGTEPGTAVRHRDVVLVDFHSRRPLLASTRLNLRLAYLNLSAVFLLNPLFE